MSERIRIAWEINGAKGNGEWQDESKSDTMWALIDELDSRYGDGTHWMEFKSIEDMYDKNPTALPFELGYKTEYPFLIRLVSLFCFE